MSLNGKVALVTGGGHGIGAAIVRALATAGASVAINYRRSAAEAQALAAEIAAAGGRTVVLRGDMAIRAEISALFEAVDREFGRLDILVNNAGIGARLALDDVSEAEFDRIYATNVKGPLFAAQEAARRMGAGGRIVNLSSSTAVFPKPGNSIYASSKAAVRMLSEVWAKELGPKGITVNTVTPGGTSPGMLDSFPPEVIATVAANSPFNRIGTAAEVASIVAFLCSEEASWVTGQEIVANGGAYN